MALVVVHAPGDGFCFFHCVSMFLRRSHVPDEDHMCYVRDAIIAWVWKYFQRFSSDPSNVFVQGLRIAATEESQPTVRDYLRRVRERGFGGSEMHIGASHVFRINVVVHTAPKRSFESSRPPTKPVRTMHVLYSGRIHYDLLVVQKGRQKVRVA